MATMPTPDDLAARDAAVKEASAIAHLKAALTELRDAQHDDRPTRERSIAITHVEDALLRLTFGSPPDLP